MNVDLSKVTLVSLITPILFLIKPSIITFISSSDSERLLLSKEVKMLTNALLILFYLIILPIVIVYKLREYKLFQSFINGYFGAILIFTIIIVGYIGSIFYWRHLNS